MRILFIGTLYSGSNARSMADGFRSAGHDVRAIDITRWARPKKLTPAWHYMRVNGRLPRAANDQLATAIRESCAGWQPDVLFCFRPVAFDQSLFDIPKTRLVHYSPDDVSNTDNTSAGYLAHETMWDLIVTTKRHNVPELVTRGAREVLFVFSAYDPLIHYPGSTPWSERRYDIGFIGAARPDRAKLPEEFASRAPEAGVVIGPRWRRTYPLGKRGVDLQPSIDGNAFARAANQFRAGLVLLNTANRDQHTCRSFETPACGNLVIGQRTAEHEEILEDGKEALFFDTKTQLWMHLEASKADPGWAQRIAMAGRERMLKSRHTYLDRGQTILAAL